MIRKIRRILNGETVALENMLLQEMTALAENLKFEEAQIVKEKYEAVKRYNSISVISRQEAVDNYSRDQKNC